MLRLASFLLSFVLAGGAGAQTRVAAAVEVRLALPTEIGSAPSILTPTTLAAAPFAPSGFSAAPALAGPFLPAASVPVPAPPTAAAPAAVPPAAAPAPESNVAAALPPSLAAASVLVPGRDDAPGSAGAKAAAAFDGGRPLNVLMAGSEAVPFIKTGGLADVVDAVARGLAARGQRVMLVLPNYRQLKKNGVEFSHAGEVSVPISGRVETARLLRATVGGVDVVLLDHPGYYDRPGGPYDGHSSRSADDGDERFAFYSRAALEAARALDFRPDVVHAHDWHAGLIPAFLKQVYASDPFFAAARSVFTIHNIAYQGLFPLESAVKFGFSHEQTYPAAPLEYWGKSSFLKAGLVLADAVTTVSPSYAREILGEQFGMGMQGVLNARPDGVQGILNGIDPKLYDPKTDPILPRNYSPEDVAVGKAANKAWIQEKLGFERKPNAPLFGIVARLAQQKGIDLVLEEIDAIVARGGQVVVTGSGDKDLEAALAAAVARHPGKVASHTHDESFARIVFAASDFMLMPSRFEPCGLVQMYAQRYGAIPIVTKIGGLADTVRDLRTDAHSGDGIFIRGFTGQALLEAVGAAIAGYRNPHALAAARANAMAQDNSWEPALDLYEALYRRLTGTETVQAWSPLKS